MLFSVTAVLSQTSITAKVLIQIGSSQLIGNVITQFGLRQTPGGGENIYMGHENDKDCSLCMGYEKSP